MKEKYRITSVKNEDIFIAKKTLYIIFIEKETTVVRKFLVWAPTSYHADKLFRKVRDEEAAAGEPLVTGDYTYHIMPVEFEREIYDV